MSTTTNDDKRNKPLSKGELIIPCKNPMVREKVLDGSLEGWILHEIPRSQTRLDKYWYSPQKNKQFRSRIGVEKFIDILNEVGKDNEDIALKRFKLYQKEKKAKKGKKREKGKKSIRIYSSNKQEEGNNTNRICKKNYRREKNSTFRCSCSSGGAY